MTKTDQDQEYVLGTKQLLSAFFVVVALLGVFFTAGYIIGRNTGPKNTVVAADGSADASPGSEAARRTAAHGAEPAPEPPVADANAAISRPAPGHTAAGNPSEAPATPAIVTAAKDKPVSPPEEVGAVTSQVTPGHLYLQLMAVKRPVADTMVKLLKGRGYPALLGESSKPELFRVLVGPFTDMASLAKTKSGLKAAGFESVIAK